MSQESYEAFRRVVLQDAALQEKLRAASDFQVFTPLAVQLGRERGFDFAAVDVEAARQASQRAWIERWL